MAKGKEDASIFDDAEVRDELPEGDEEAPDNANSKEEVWSVQTITESPKDRMERIGKKEKADGKILTIEAVDFTKPKFKTPEGQRIAPKKTIDGSKEYYSGKLKIKFAEDNLVEYYPNFHYFVDDKGRIGNLAKINREGNNAVTHLFKLAVPLIGKPEDEISDGEFYKFLVGKKVKVTTAAGKYMGKEWFRNDITAFV